MIKLQSDPHVAIQDKNQWNIFLPLSLSLSASLSRALPLSDCTELGLGKESNRNSPKNAMKEWKNPQHRIKKTLIPLPRTQSTKQETEKETQFPSGIESNPPEAGIQKEGKKKRERMSRGK